MHAMGSRIFIRIRSCAVDKGLGKCRSGRGLTVGEGVTSQAPEEPNTSSDEGPHGQVYGKLFDTTYVSGRRCGAAVSQQGE